MNRAPQLIRILQPSGQHLAEPARRCRIWLQIGQAWALRGMVMIPVDAGQELLLNFYSPDGRELVIKPMKPISWEPAEPYRIIPRAVRFIAGRADAVLLEIQHTGPGRPCWKTTDALEGHHAKPNNEQKGI